MTLNWPSLLIISGLCRTFKNFRGFLVTFWVEDYFWQTNSQLLSFSTFCSKILWLSKKIQVFFEKHGEDTCPFFSRSSSSGYATTFQCRLQSKSRNLDKWQKKTNKLRSATKKRQTQVSDKKKTNIDHSLVANNFHMKFLARFLEYCINQRIPLLRTIFQVDQFFKNEHIELPQVVNTLNNHIARISLKPTKVQLTVVL